MTTRRPSRGFPGSELGGLLALSGLLVVVLALILVTRRPEAQPQPPAPIPAADLPALPPPDPAPELQGIQDRAPMNARDTAAYKLLVERAREHPSDEQRDQARTEIVYSQLFDDPQRYRGLPLHVEGFARRVLAYDVEDSVVFPDGRFYEAYVFTPDSQSNPYILAFEQAPPSLPVGDAIEEYVRFDGYFLKLMAYLAGDGKYRAAPLIVGRFDPSTMAERQPPEPPGAPSFARNWPWILGGVLLSILLIRAGLQLQRSLLTGRRGPRPGQSAVSDHIDPEELSAWIEHEQQRDDDDDDEDDEDRATRDKPLSG